MPSGSYNELGSQSGSGGTLPGRGPIVVTAFSETLLDNSTLAEWQTDLGIAAGTFQPLDAGLTSIAALVTAADKGIYTTALDTYATFDLTTFARTLLADPTAAAMRTTLGLVIGTDVLSPSGSGASLTALNATQLTTGTVPNARLDAELQAIAGLTSAADRLPYFTGSGTAALATFTAFARTILDDPDAGTVRTTIGAAGLADSNTFSGQNTFNNSSAFNALVEINNSDLTVTGGGTISGDGSGLTGLNGGAVGSGVDSGNVDYTSTGTGAVAVTISSLLNVGYVTPEMFGAAGDGVADDTDEFKLARDAAWAQDRILFLPNTYKISDEILIDKPGLRICGVHDDQTSPSKVVQTATNKAAFRIVNETAFASNNFITFSDLVIDGPGIGTSTTAGIHIDSDGTTFFDEINLYRVRIQDFNIGLLAERWSNSTVHQCTFDTNNWGVDIASGGLCNAIQFLNCWFGNNTNTQVRIASANSPMSFRSCEWQMTGVGKMMYITGGTVVIDCGNSEGGSGIGSDGTSGILCELGGANARLTVRGLTFLAGTTSAIPIRCSASGSGVVIGANCTHNSFDAGVAFAETYRNISANTTHEPGALNLVKIYDTNGFTGTPHELYSSFGQGYYTADLPAAAVTNHGVAFRTIDATNEVAYLNLRVGGTYTLLPLTPTALSNAWPFGQAFNGSTNIFGSASFGTGAYKLEVVSAGSQIRVGTSTADSGGYIGSRSTNQLELFGGATHTGSGYVAKATTASSQWFASGDTYFYNQSGLTAGNAYTPTLRFYITAAGKVRRRLVAGATDGYVPAVMNVNVTAVGNVGAGEDDLQTYTVPGGLLTDNGDAVRITAEVTFAANGNNKRVKSYWNAVAVYDSTALAINAGAAKIVTTITRTGAATQNVSIEVISGNATLAHSFTATTGAGTLSGNVVYKLTGEATSNDDIINRQTIVEYLPAA